MTGIKNPDSCRDAKVREWKGFEVPRQIFFSSSYAERFLYPMPQYQNNRFLLLQCYNNNRSGLNLSAPPVLHSTPPAIHKDRHSESRNKKISGIDHFKRYEKAKPGKDSCLKKGWTIFVYAENPGIIYCIYFFSIHSFLSTPAQLSEILFPQSHELSHGTGSQLW